MGRRRFGSTSVALVLAVLTAASLLTGLSLGGAQRAEALSGSDFDPGNIISDANFYNGAAMSEGEIQQFLVNAVGGSCQNSNCLAVYRADTPTRTWSFGTCSTYQGASGESAARIIFKVQQACGLSAKVILVTLQKEQSLVTARAPSSGVMQKAMGYGCPDTAACDSTYYGFFNQVFAAGRQLTWYNNPGGSFTSIKIGQVNQIRYHPNAACGTKSVLVQNRATAALYYYTPYTPNAAALANLGGTGDGCSAYGNRNFWVFYNNWFGASVGPEPRRFIDAEWGAQGGLAGLGAPVSDYLAISQNGGGLGRAYERGSVYWSASTGAKTVWSGAIRDYYFARGGAAGWLGWPTANRGEVPQNGGGIAQAFTGGSIYSSPAAGTFGVPEALRTAYFTLNGSAGPLAWPVSDALARSEQGGGTEQRFQGGAVYRSKYGAFPVLAPILGVLDTTGGLGGTLGWPTSGSIAIPQNGGGTGQAFLYGSVYQSAAGAFAVSGALRDAYFARGGSAGGLGWPVAAAVCTGARCQQDFQFGRLVIDGGAVSVISAEIEAVYLSMGGQSGPLGPSTSGLLRVDANGGGLAVAYRGGSIYFKRSVGAFAVLPPVITRYFIAGGSAGPFGWPMSGETCQRGGADCVQVFEGVRLYRSFDDVARTSTDAIFTVYGVSGGARGPLGPTASDLVTIPQNGGGVGQAFRSGSIYMKNGGQPFTVSGTVRDHYFQVGGAAGSLGWPTSSTTCGGGRCVQSFERGTIDVAAPGT